MSHRRIHESTKKLANKPLAPDEEHISSVVIQAYPEHLPAIVEQLSENKQLDIVVVANTQGKIIVLITAASTDATSRTIESFRQLPGVVHVAMVYHHVETRDRMQEDIS